jgi:hypothetical protein
MAFVPVVNAARVEMVFDQEGQICENVFHVRGSSPFDYTSLALLAATFKDWHDINLKTIQVTTCALFKILATALDAEDAPSLEYTTGLPVIGTGGSDPLPMNVTVAVKWLTGFRGRSFRGRSYHVGMSRSDTLFSLMNAASIAPFEAAYNALIALITVPGQDLVVVSYVHNKLPRVEPLCTPIVGAFVEITLDSQRRRLPGRGT